MGISLPWIKAWSGLSHWSMPQRTLDLSCGGRGNTVSLLHCRSRDSAVGIATGYGLDDRGVGVWVSVGVRIFTSPCRPDRLWGPPNLLSNGYRGALSLRVKRPGRESDHSPPTSAEVKKICLYVQPQRGNFTSTIALTSGTEKFLSGTFTLAT
jgi:hypothetical protein